MSKEPKQMLLNAFTQCSICHHSKGQWKNPIDGSSKGYKEIEYWVDLAKKLEEGCFDALFLADIHGTYNVYKNSRKPQSDILSSFQVMTQHYRFLQWLMRRNI